MRKSQIKASFGMNPLASLLPLVLVICLLGIVQSACPAGKLWSQFRLLMRDRWNCNWCLRSWVVFNREPIHLPDLSNRNEVSFHWVNGSDSLRLRLISTEYRTNVSQPKNIFSSEFLTFVRSCITCPAGHMCPVTTIAPVACPSGWYAATG